MQMFLFNSVSKTRLKHLLCRHVEPVGGHFLRQLRAGAMMRHAARFCHGARGLLIAESHPVHPENNLIDTLYNFNIQDLGGLIM